jgi:hypothetical protein
MKTAQRKKSATFGTHHFEPEVARKIETWVDPVTTEDWNKMVDRFKKQPASKPPPKAKRHLKI